MNARHLAGAVLLVGLGSLSPIGADDRPVESPPPPTSPTPGARIEVPDPTPYLDAAGASVVSVTRDGSQVFFTRRVAGIVQLFVTDSDGKSVRQLTTGGQSLSFAVPAPDGSKVILGYDHDGDENTGLFLLESTSKPTEPVALAVAGGVQQGGVVWPTEYHGGRFFYRANDKHRATFRIHAWTIGGGVADTVVFDSPGSWRVEDASPGGARLLLVRERSSGDASLCLLHVETHSLTEIHPDLEGATSAVKRARFLGNGSEIAFTQEYPSVDGDVFTKTWSFDCATGATREIPTLCGSCEAADLAILSEDTRIYVRKSNPEGSAFELTNSHLNGWVTGRHEPGEFSGVFPDAEGHVYSSRSSPSDPGSIVRFELRQGTFSEPQTLLTADLGTLVKSVLPDDPTLVRLIAADKTELQTWLWLPKGKAPKHLPFIVSIHGGPEGEDRPGWHADRAYLLSLGFGVLAPNVRGSTGRGRRFRDADDGAKRMDAVRDAKAAADWLVEQGYADPKRLGIMGGSYGGFMVMALLTEFPDRFVAGAEAVGIVNFETFLEKTSSYRRALREAEYGSLSDRELLRSISPIHKLDRITAALLVAHGENDPRVPVGEARQIEDELRRLGRLVETLIFPDEGHGFRKPANRRAHLEAVARFFLTHLAPR